jgi:Protein of unknown function (DUF1640)
MPAEQDAPKREASNSAPTQQDQQETASDLASGVKAQPETVEEVVPTNSDLRTISTAKEATETKEDEPVTPLDIVLKITPPSDVRGEKHKHPHLVPSPYEHHFDTYSLVQDLAKGDFTADQAVTIMKAVRLMLAVNLDIAKDGLVSKSDVENETYLFRAACSELRTSLQSSRHSEIQRQRTQRAHLHHEYDILNQRVTQDMLTLREELKAMFNDRKMAVQEEKQRLDSKISELNYEITVLLNSDSKSEVEGLRWVLTRRAALAIAISACEYNNCRPSGFLLTLVSDDVNLVKLLIISNARKRRSGEEDCSGENEGGREGGAIHDPVPRPRHPNSN